MQLVAYGAQDVYLTGNPQITFWKVTYRRHTNFAMESIEQTFNGQADFGRRVTCTLARTGFATAHIFRSLFRDRPEPGTICPRRLQWADYRSGWGWGRRTAHRPSVRWLDAHLNQLTLSKSRSVDTTRWLVTPPSLPTSLILSSPQSMDLVIPAHPARYAPSQCSSWDHTTCHSSSGTAATQDLLFLWSHFSTTRPHQPYIAQSMSA